MSRSRRTVRRPRERAERGASHAGERFEAEVGPVAHGGHCVARYDGRVIFVRLALPGDQAEVVNHETGVAVPGERRDMRVEAARITHGGVVPIGGVRLRPFLEAFVDEQRAQRGQHAVQFVQRQLGFSGLSHHQHVDEVFGVGQPVGLLQVKDRDQPVRRPCGARLLEVLGRVLVRMLGRDVYSTYGPTADTEKKEVYAPALTE